MDTWRLEEPDALAEVLDRLDELVVKPVDASGGKGLVVGPRASASTLASLRRTLSNDPRGWIAQPVVQLSTIPTLVEEAVDPPPDSFVPTVDVFDQGLAPQQVAGRHIEHHADHLRRRRRGL